MKASQSLSAQFYLEYSPEKKNIRSQPKQEIIIILQNVIKMNHFRSVRSPRKKPEYSYTQGKRYLRIFFRQVKWKIKKLRQNEVKEKDTRWEPRDIAMKSDIEFHLVIWSSYKCTFLSSCFYVYCVRQRTFKPVDEPSDSILDGKKFK